MRGEDMKYLVMAYRCGTNEYIFPVGLFDSKSDAVNAARLHYEYRGGKYDHKVYEIKENENFRLTLIKNLCSKPDGLYHIECIQEQISDGEVTTASSYEFFLNRDELKKISESLTLE
jgi:hypothetical protein